MTSKSIKQQVLEHFGGPTGLAAKLGCNPQAISQWDQIPELRTYQIEVVSGGVFRATEILARQQAERLAAGVKEEAA